MRLKNKNVSKKVFLIGLAAVIILAAGGVVGWNYINNESGPSSADTTEKLNLDPPTSEEQAQGDLQKDEIVKRDEAIKQNTPTQGSKRTVKPQITFADDYGQTIEVAGVVSGVFESTATCKLTLSKDGRFIVKETRATQSSSQMNCPTIEVAQSEFYSLGTWQATLEYISDTAGGTSDSAVVEVR